MISSARVLWSKIQSADPRIFVSMILFTYLVLGLTVLGFNRSPAQAVTTTLLCCGLDLILHRIFTGRFVFPLSALITSFSLSFLLSYSHSSWMILLPPMLAIGSKYVLRFNGRHFFNPAMFAVATSLIVSQELITAAPAYQWNGIATMSIFIVMLGFIFIIPKIGRNWLVGSFLITFTLQTCLRAIIMRHHLPFSTLFFGTLSSPSFFVFTFFMITDPATSPPRKKDQIIVGASIALVDLAFHLRQSYYTFFYAALTVASIRFVYFHLGRLYEEGYFNGLRIHFIESRYWKKPLLVGVTFFVSAIAYAKILHPETHDAKIDFNFITLPSEVTGLNADHEGDLLAKLDPRVQHIAKWLLAETEGIATGDFDGDGKLDLFLTQPLKENDQRAALYRNLGDDHFEHVPIPALKEIALHPEKYGIISNAMFVDYDNDGDQDLFLTVVHGHSILLKNMLKETGHPTFIDVTHEVGLDQFYTQSISATLADFNRDGLLDLFIANALEKTIPDYDPPELLSLFHLPAARDADDHRMFNFMHASWNMANNGGQNLMFFQTADHKFVQQDPHLWGGDETRWSLAVGAADFNHDGWPDLYVANDFGPDELYYNHEGKYFESIKGSVFGSIGRDTYKGMNVSIADFDHTGFQDVYISDVHHPLQAEGSLFWEFTKGTNDFYPVIEERATQKGILNEHRFGWGAVAADFNNDGWMDLAQANGMVDDTYDKRYAVCPDYWYINEKIARSPPAYHRFADHWGDIRGYCIFGKEKNRLYLNRGVGLRPQFIDVAEEVGLKEETNSRGVIAADFDNQGRMDLVFAHPFSKPTFLKNHATNSLNNWAGLSLEGNGKTCNRDAVGTRVEVTVNRKDQTTFQFSSEVQTVSGLLAQSDRRLHFGLGPNAQEVQAIIHWCGQGSQKVKLSLNRYQHEVQP